MKIDDGLALAPSAVGYWPEDGWLGATSSLPILFYQPVRSVRLEFWLPPGSRKRQAEVTLSSWRTECVIEADQVVNVDVPISKNSSGVTLKVEIDADPAPPPDIRMLGAILAGIRRL